VKTLAFPVTRAKVAKYGMVMLHGAAGFVVAVAVDLLLFNWIGRRPAVRVVAELFVIGAVLWAGGRVLIRHLLVESIMVFERSGVRSAFARSGRLVAPRIGRTLELLASSWILLVFIGISTGEVLDVVRWILPFPAVWQGVAISTQICLMPIVLINIVVYALMLMRPEFDEKGAATPIGL